MNRITILLVILAALVAGPTAWAGSGDSRAAAPAGRFPPSVEKVIGEAAAEGLPVQGLKAKAAEGLAKRVSPDVLACACRVRLDFLRKARELVGPDSSHCVLLESIGRSLESGLDPAVVREIADQAGAQSIPPGRLAAVIDAGEDAWLSGLSAKDVRDLMQELLQRGASRGECHLAVQRAGQLKGEGNQGESLKQRLWGKGRPSKCPGCENPSKADSKKNGHQGSGGCGGKGPGSSSGPS